MKTKHVWFALSALAIAGCSQNEITEISPEANPEVGFSVFTGTQTKGTITITQVPQVSKRRVSECWRIIRERMISGVEVMQVLLLISCGTKR